MGVMAEPVTVHMNSEDSVSPHLTCANTCHVKAEIVSQASYNTCTCHSLPSTHICMPTRHEMITGQLFGLMHMHHNASQAWLFDTDMEVRGRAALTLKWGSCRTRCRAADRVEAVSRSGGTVKPKPWYSTCTVQPTCAWVNRHDLQKSMHIARQRCSCAVGVFIKT